MYNVLNTIKYFWSRYDKKNNKKHLIKPQETGFAIGLMDFMKKQILLSRNQHKLDYVIPFEIK